MIIAIDFDGTVVADNFPHIGKDIGAEPVLRKLLEKGHDLILTTLRADREILNDDGEFVPDIGTSYLTEAVNWFQERDIPLYGIQRHPKYPNSDKLVYDFIIDDRAIGVPMKNSDIIGRYVDWEKIEIILEDMGLL